MKGRFANPLTLSLLGACLLFGYLLAQAPPPPDETAPVAGVVQTEAETPSKDADVAVPLSFYREIAERPLFNPERRPPPPPTPVPAGAPSLSMVLEGVVLSGANISVLVRGRGNKRQWLSLGDQLEGWELRGVEREQADFHHDGKTVTLNLKPVSGSP